MTHHRDKVIENNPTAYEAEDEIKRMEIIVWKKYL